MEKVINKFWGKEEWLKVTNNYALKKLTIDRGKSISLQYHEVKEETMYVASGEGYMTFENEKFVISPGDTIHIPPGTVHQILALSRMEIIEASTTELDDVVRLKDNCEKGLIIDVYC